MGMRRKSKRVALVTIRVPGVSTVYWTRVKNDHCKLAANIRGESQEHTEGHTKCQKYHTSALQSWGRTRNVPPHNDGVSSIVLRFREEEVPREEHD